MISGGAGSCVRVDAADECIWRDGDRINVPPKAFLVLRCLMAQPNQLVTKRQLMAAAWAETAVTDVVLNVAIRQLREAFADDSKAPRFIETVHRRGFRWIGDISPESSVLSPESGCQLTVEGSVLRTEDSGLSTECVGRAATIAALDKCFARAVAGQRQLVFVTGDPGIGKTAVVDHFLARLVAKTPGLIARGQCTESFIAGEAYRPIVEAIESLLRRGGSAMRAVFVKHAPTWLLQMPELSTPEELEALRRTVMASTGDRMQREAERAIEAASAARPIVLVLEDLHWSDPATVGLLWALAARREAAQLLIIGTYRPVDAIAEQHPIVRMKQELTGKKQCVEIALDGLDAAAIGIYLDGRFADHALPADFAPRLRTQTSGNPLFLLNALAEFEERGWLSRRDGTWTCSVGLDTLDAAMPDGTRDLISFRLDQLPPATQELLEAASAAGEIFPTQVLAAAVERGCDAVESECGRLARAGLFLQAGVDVEWPDASRGRQYNFRHALYRQVLDAKVTPARRQLLHQRIAARLESGYGGRSSEIAGPLSFHWEHAGEMLRAAGYLEELVRQTYSRRATHEAEALAAHAVVLLKRLPPREENRKLLLQATIGYGLALGTSRGVGSVEAEQAFSDARALGQSIPMSEGHVMSMVSLVLGAVMSGRLQEARRLGEELLAMSGPDALPLVAICAHMAVGIARLYLGDVGVSIEHLEHGRALLDKEPYAKTPSNLFLRGPRVALDTTLGTALILAGHSERGWALIMAALEFTKTMEVPWFRVMALATASVSATIRGDLPLARQWSAELLAYGEAHGFAFWPEMQRVHLAWAAVIETRDPERLDALVQAINAFRPIGHLAMPRAFGLLADASLCVGRLDDASRALDEAFDPRWEERLYYAELWRQRAAVVLARPAKKKSAQCAEAEQLLRQALEIANTQGARLFSLRIAVDLCRLWHAAGKVQAARQRLSEAIAGFDAGLSEVDLRTANELLAQWSG